jgi:membrane protease subunit (stomatin/prohibitin family)
VIIDVVLAVNSESRIAPANIHRMQRMRAMVDLGDLSPYLKHDGYYTVDGFIVVILLFRSLFKKPLVQKH